jgi:hypothetical protein
MTANSTKSNWVLLSAGLVPGLVVLLLKYLN